ncbi:hypothetical protein ACRZ5S_07030 [Vibrio scophthalmi]|uniref:hypothetical protein n=1 Tax=Vibrio scophthalmi TaxID=45658 RepID=UPI003EBA5C2C
MTTPYILNISSEPHRLELQLLSPLSNGRNELHWQRDLGELQRESNISLAEFYNDDEFVVATTTGRIHKGSIQGDLTLVTTLPVMGIHGGKGWLDKTKQEFWYAATAKIDDEQGDRLYGWNLKNWQLIAQVQLPEYLDIQQLHRRRDGSFLFYQKCSGKLHKRTQGFWVINPVTGEANHHLLDSLPAAGMYQTRNMLALCPKRDIALLPFFDTLPYQENKGDLQLGFQLQLVDLNSFNTLWIKTVRWFGNDTEQILDDEVRQTLQDYYADEELDDDDVEDALEEWVETLKGIRFSDQEDACWLCWADGTLRKLYFSHRQQDYQLTAMSPLVMPTQESEESGQPNPLNQVAFNQYDYHLQVLNHHQLAVINCDIKIVDIAEVKPSDNELAQQTVTYQKAKQAEVEMNDAFRMSYTRDGINVIEIDYLALPECVLEGLQEMRQRTACLEDHVKGIRLEWLIEDQDGSQRSEADFCAMAIKLSGAANMMEQIIENFCAYPYASKLISGENKAALSDMVLSLAAHNIRYLPLVNRYLNIIDVAQFGRFHTQHTLPLIEQLYGQSLRHKFKYHNFIKNLPTDLPIIQPINK